MFIKKYRLIILILFITLFFVNRVDGSELPLFQKVIVVDPGHDGY